MNNGHNPRNHTGAKLDWPGAKTDDDFHFRQTENKAVIHMGGTDAYLNKRVNWFHRWTIRFVFGWKVENL